MFTEDDKIQSFLELMALNRKNTFELIKHYLIMYNPPIDMIPELKKIMEDQNIFLENDTFDFLDKWIEYKKCLKSSTEIQYKESMDKRFNEIMNQNFKGVA